MIRDNITQQQLLDAVCKYEKEVRNTSFKCETEIHQIYRFKAPRREKLVIILLSGAFSKKQEELIGYASRLILDDVSLSDNIDFYTTAPITEKRAAELELPLRQLGVTISFFDSQRIEKTDQFSELLETVEYEEIGKELDSSFFDYLALSNDSTDIKNGFLYSLILIEVYRHQPVTENEFCEICEEKYGKKQAEIKLALKSLRKKKKITPLKKGGVFSLTDTEQRCVEDAIRESKAKESAFKTELSCIISKYGFYDSTVILEKLKKEYLSKYTYYSDIYDEGDEKEGKNTENNVEWNEILKGLNDNVIQNMLGELKDLCARNDYVDQYALIHSFLNLFRSNQYEGYIKQKEQIVYLDTPVIVNYICSKSSYQNDYEIEWEDTDFMSTNDLFNYSADSSDKIRFLIPHDYLIEVLGELKKALQFNWFNQFEDLPIPVKTANVFYNYYQEVKNRKHLFEDCDGDFTFEDFVAKLGFEEKDPESIVFFSKNIAYLRHYLNMMGCETLEKVDVNHSLFDLVKTDYLWYLHDKRKDKSESAIKADVRQALHITEETKSSNIDCEYYLVSWDNTLYFLRNKVKEVMEIAGRSYNVYKPGELAEKMAFRNFRIRKEYVNNEVFTYANTSFNVSDKIRSMYDNVMNPYFASFGKSNATLAIEVLKMQRASMDGGEDISSKDDKTALENIFISITTELPKHNCSTQNLKDFLNDELNNNSIIPLFYKAFDDYKNGNQINIAKQVCELVKSYVSKDEKEIRL